MEQQFDDIQNEQTEPHYVPRPRWQIVLAWVGLGIMLVSVALYYIHIAKGGVL